MGMSRPFFECGGIAQTMVLLALSCTVCFAMTATDHQVVRTGVLHESIRCRPSEIHGRCQDSEDFTLFDWPTIKLRKCFTLLENATAGISLKINGGHNRFDVFLNGAYVSTLETSLETEVFPIWKGSGSEAEGNNLCVELLKRTEASLLPLLVVETVRVYEWQYVGMEPAVLPVPTRCMEVFGDSDSNGFGILGKPSENPWCMLEAKKQEDATVSWPSALQHKYDPTAALYVQAWSGKGVVHNAADIFGDKSRVTLPILANRTLATSDAHVWVPSKDMAHCTDAYTVYVYLGSNDYFSFVHPTQDEFTSGYKSFIASLVAERPPHVSYVHVCGGYPLNSTSIPYCSYIQNAIAEVPGTHDFVFVPAAFYGTTDIGCIGHINSNGQKKLADFIAASRKESTHKSHSRGITLRSQS